MTKLFRLPDGTACSDSERYAKEWFTLADEVASLFPGYRVNGVDPDIMLSSENWSSSFRLSVEAAQLLISEVNRRVAARESG